MYILTNSVDCCTRYEIGHAVDTVKTESCKGKIEAGMVCAEIGLSIRCMCADWGGGGGEGIGLGSMCS